MLRSRRVHARSFRADLLSRLASSTGYSPPRPGTPRYNYTRYCIIYEDTGDTSCRLFPLSLWKIREPAVIRAGAQITLIAARARRQPGNQRLRMRNTRVHQLPVLTSPSVPNFGSRKIRDSPRRLSALFLPRFLANRTNIEEMSFLSSNPVIRVIGVILGNGVNRVDGVVESSRDR